MIVGSRIKDLRLEKNLSQQNLADELGVTKVSICGYENGKRIPSLDTFISLSNYFKVSTDYLLGRIDDRKINNDNISSTINDLSIIKEIQKYPNLYRKILKSPKRYVNLIYKKLK